ncbi:MAG: YraN family protein [Candidatus Symbiodolus clandestinus]
MGTLSPWSKSSVALASRQKSYYYEQQARRYLEQAGLRYIAANVLCRGGEIDLIMQQQQTWVFVEVRYRRTNRYGGALISVTLRKQRCLYHAARVWLLRQGLCINIAPCRFDVIAFTGESPTIDWIPNAFTINW